MAKKNKDDDATPASDGPVPVHIGGESILDRLIPHMKKLLVAAVVIAVILGAFFGYRWWKNEQRAEETGALVKAMDVLRSEVVVAAPVDPTQPDKQPDPKPNTFSTYKSRAEAGLAALAKGGAEKVGALYRAGLLLEAGRLDEAEAAYKAASSAKGLDGVLAREGLGFVAEARAQAAKDPAEKQRHLEAALAAFKSAQTDDKGVRRDHALYHEARILALLDKRPEAVAALEKALEVAPETELEEQIEARLALLGAQQ